MSKDLDEVINELTDHFREELQKLKEEEYEKDYIEFLKNELKMELQIAKEAELEAAILEEIKMELAKDDVDDNETSLLVRVELIQRLIYQIFCKKL